MAWMGRLREIQRAVVREIRMAVVRAGRQKDGDVHPQPARRPVPHRRVERPDLRVPAGRSGDVQRAGLLRPRLEPVALCRSAPGAASQHLAAAGLRAVSLEPHAQAGQAGMPPAIQVAKLKQWQGNVSSSSFFIIIFTLEPIK